MTLPRTVADVLADHMVFEVECIDRLYCNVYVPQLQHAGGLLGYVQRQLGLPIASTAPLGKITEEFSAALRRFATGQGVPWVDFAKGQRKDATPGSQPSWPVSAPRTARFGRLADAARHLIEAVTLFHRHGSPSVAANAHESLGATLHLQGRFDVAIQLPLNGVVPGPGGSLTSRRPVGLMEHVM